MERYSTPSIQPVEEEAELFNQLASDASERGTLRALTWGEKVTCITYDYSKLFSQLFLLLLLNNHMQKFQILLHLPILQFLNQ